MTTTELLNQLTQQGVQLWAEGDKLKFRAPQGALTTEQQILLKKHKADLLRVLGNPDTCPVSFSQQRLWFLHQMEPDSAFYNTPLLFELTGHLDLVALGKTLNEIVRRHDTLRTTFTTVDDEPIQIVAPYHPFTVSALDIQEEIKQGGAKQKYIDAEFKQPFDLESGPLIRFKLLRLAETRFQLLITMHHIISDGWSQAVLHRELTSLYTAFIQDQPSPLPELPLQYADFSRWQQAWFQGERTQIQLTYWQTKLAGHLPILDLPMDHPRPATQSFWGRRHIITIPQTLYEALKTLSRQENNTLFVTLLTAFKVLLFRYTQQTDILVGMPVANRTRSDVEPLIGFFVNTLVLRTDLSNTPTFRELLQTVRQTVLEAQAHQDLPFEKLVEVLQPERNLSYSPLVQVMISLESGLQSSVELPELTLTTQDVDDGSAKFDLFLDMSETEAGLQVQFQYNIDLFEAETIERMAGHYQTLLENIVTNPDASVAEISMLTAAEQYQLLHLWPDTATAYPRDALIHQLFEAQAEQSPDAVALVFEDRVLTYADLNHQANQLAHYLKTAEVKPGDFVGLCLDRSIELIVGTLAILKAGAAYVPLDPAYPDERLTFMFNDTQMPLLLTDSRLVHQLPPYTGQLVCLDDEWAKIEQQPVTNLSDTLEPVTAQDLAYVMYTSGSTGQPKGVCVTHRNVVRLVKETNFITITDDDTFLQFAPISFDAATLEIWGPLLNGGRLVVFPAGLPTLETLGDVIEQNGVTTLWLTAGLFHQMVDTQLDKLRGVRQLLAGGDVLSVSHVRRVLDELPDTCLINGYGPTENTTFTTCYPMTRGTMFETSVPIGKPIANTQVYILDAQMKPVPIGVPGELYTGGDGVSQGYLNRPDLTAEKFISNPFSSEAELKLYRTGDLARYLPDGNVEFLGRIDNQVKIRGFRIELGEIETILSQHLDVEKCVVVAREDRPGNKRLVAYVVGKQETEAKQADLRQHLKIHLPDYMIPAAFVMLDDLPIDPNGKINRRALPAPDTSRIDVTDFVAPEGAVQEMLAEMWQELLQFERIGVHDNFFHLGGHSLLATQIVSRLRQAYAIDVSVRTLFEAPTIAELAALIEGEQVKSKDGEVRATDPIQPMMPQPLTQPVSVPLTLGQEGIWYTEQLRPGSAAYNMPMVWRVGGALDVAVLEQSLNVLIQRHTVFRTHFEVSEGQPKAIVWPDMHITLDKADLQHLPQSEQAQQVDTLIQAEANRPFDLTEAPLLRASVIQLDPTSFIVTLTIHHIIGDGWSLGVLARDLTAIYNALIVGQTPTLPDLSIQYADFAHWTQAQQEGERFANHLAYWEQRLADAPPILELPTDYVRPSVYNYTGDQVSLTLPPSLTEAIGVLSRQHQATLFMTLLTAFKMLLYRYTAQSQIVVGSPIIHRPQPELEPLVGYFLNNLVLHTDLSGEPTFRELLDKVRQTSLDAYTYQDVPYETIVQRLRPERDLSYNPLFQVAFNLLSATIDHSQLNLADLNVETVSQSEIEAHSKFDLTLYVRPNETEIQLYLVYRTDLFRPERMNEMLTQYQHLLHQIVADPSQSISAYPLNTPSAKDILPNPLHPVSAPTQPLVTDLIAAWAKKSPDHPALSQGNRTWTYQQLIAQGYHIARNLRASEVQTGDVVAIYGTRQFGLITSILGTLLSGGVFILIDPFLPDERKRMLLQEAGVKWLILVDGVSDLSPAEDWLNDDIAGRLSVDGVTGQVNVGLDVTNIILPTVDENDPAYIFFTSGSTGKPKGILGCHKGLSHFIRWQSETFEVTPNDRVAQLIGLSFDVILRDIFLPLTRGATLCLPDQVDGLNLADPIAWFNEARITMLHTVPALVQTWLATDEALPQLPHLRCAFFAGEPLTDNLVARWREMCPNSQVVNLYGPTETTMAKCYYVVPEATQPGVQPIGHPLPQTQIFIMAENDRPCGLYEPGQIVIRTPFRTLGYINASPEAQKQFRPNPFTDDPQDLFYYTGDLGYYQADGILTILGRMDDQVKVRGVRIELGEIIATLAQHPAVQANTVIAKQDEQGQNYLVAYVVAKVGDVLDEVELSTYLSKILMPAMIPTAFVPLDRLPLLPTGKVNRRQLPEPNLSSTHLTDNFVEPEGIIEEMVAELWQAVLRLDRVGLYDNFFHLGGHSLLAIQFLARLKQAYGIDLPLPTLFEAPTIAELTPLIEHILISEE